jgi:hypothetical protein
VPRQSLGKVAVARSESLFSSSRAFKRVRAWTRICGSEAAPAVPPIVETAYTGPLPLPPEPLDDEPPPDEGEAHFGGHSDRSGQGFESR